MLTSRRVGRRQLGAIVTTALALFAGSLAHAHKQLPEREAVVQLDDNGVALLVRLVVRTSEASLLRFTYDLDHDGVFSPPEEVLIAAALGQKAIRGLELRIDGELQKGLRVEPKLDRVVRDGEIAVVVLVEYGNLPESKQKAEVLLGLAPGFGEVNAALQGQGVWHAEPVSAVLGGGQALHAQVVRNPQAQPKAQP